MIDLNETLILSSLICVVLGIRSVVLEFCVEKFGWRAQRRGKLPRRNALRSLSTFGLSSPLSSSMDAPIVLPLSQGNPRWCPCLPLFALLFYSSMFYRFDYINKVSFHVLRNCSSRLSARKFVRILVYRKISLQNLNAFPLLPV